MSKANDRFVFTFSCIGERGRAKGLLIARCSRHAKIVLMANLAQVHPDWHEKNLAPNAIEVELFCTSASRLFKFKITDIGE
jgi:hypothetical protein